ncbi:MAG: ABC transporter substrate-binding protein [Actinomycetota bacterium]
MLAFSLVVASCAGKLGSPGADGAAPTAGETPPPGGLAFGGLPIDELETLRLALVRPEDTTPARVSMTDQSAVIVADLLYDGLTEVVGRDGTLRPALATAWSADDDFTSWTFTLDGERIAADAVVAHFEGLVDGEVSSATGQLVSSIESVEAIDAQTVAFTLDSPDAGFAWLMSGLPVSVVGPDGGQTGRFAVAADSDRSLRLVAETADNDLRPAAVEVHWVASADDGYDLLTLGLADAAVAPVERLADARRRFGHEPVERSITVFYGVGLGDGDANRRRTVLAALDTADFDDEIALLGAAPTGGILPPALAGSREPDWPAPDGEEVTATLGAADEVAISVGFTDEGHEPLAQAMANRLLDVGFDAVVDERDVAQQAAAIADGRAGLFAFGWVAAAGSVDAVARPLLAGDSATNVLGYRSDQIDDLLAVAARTGSDEARWALLAEAHELALADARAVPLGAAFSQLVVAPPAEGLVVRADGSLDLEPTE